MVLVDVLVGVRSALVARSPSVSRVTASQRSPQHRPFPFLDFPRLFSFPRNNRTTMIRRGWCRWCVQERRSLVKSLVAVSSMMEALAGRFSQPLPSILERTRHELGQWTPLTSAFKRLYEKHGLHLVCRETVTDKCDILSVQQHIGAHRTGSSLLRVLFSNSLPRLSGNAAMGFLVG